MPKFDIHSDDPLEMVWAVREKINEETKDMPPEEFNEYIRKGAEEFKRDMQRIRAERPVAGKK